MFLEAEHLKDYWHVCALSKNVSHKPSRITLYDQAIVIWRSPSGALNGLADYCLHQKAPLSAGWTDEAGISCPYHGWVFDSQGFCRKTPSDPEFCKKIKAKVPSFSVIDSEGFVWIKPNAKSEQATGAQTPPKFRADLGNGWRFIYSHQEFDCSVEVLIENFMDSAHTAVVHNGIIRQSKASIKRQVIVDSDTMGVSVRHLACDEKIGWASRLIFGKNASLSHLDQYVVPNSVIIEYDFQPRNYRFRSIIHCTPISKNRTRAFFCVGTKFSFFNLIAPLVLKFVSKIILRQDQVILKLQLDNRAYFPEVKDVLPPSDYMHREVRKRRLGAIKQKLDQQGADSSQRQFDLHY